MQYIKREQTVMYQFNLEKQQYHIYKSTANELYQFFNTDHAYVCRLPSVAILRKQQYLETCSVDAAVGCAV